MRIVVLHAVACAQFKSDEQRKQSQKITDGKNTAGVLKKRQVRAREKKTLKPIDK